MTNKLKRMYGTWGSPISPKLMTAVRRFNDVQWDGDTLVWSETRGTQSLLVAQTGSEAPRELTEPTISVRGRVGYGGGEFTVRGGVVVFSADGRLYRQPLSGGRPRPITPAFGAAAAPAISPDGQWIVFVMSYEGVDGLALVDAAGEHFPRKLAYGTDFVMQPTWSPHGQHLAYVTWNHPAMPFTGARLQLAHLERDHAGVPYVARIETIAGSDTVSVFQPEFSPDGQHLAYISDATGWNQLYLYEFATGEHTPITDAPADHGQAAWVQGLRTYGWSPDGRAIIYRRVEQASASLWRMDLRTARRERVRGTEQYTHFDQISVSPEDAIATIASSSTIPARVVSFGAADEPLSGLNYDGPGLNVLVPAPRGDQIHARSSTETLSGLAVAQALTFTAPDGEAIYGLYYAPTSDRFEDPTAPPPLIVNVHGGPTGHTPNSFNLKAQFFATRGIAFLDLNHRGSTGYGRAYMDKLAGAWGIYDVDDSVIAAEQLVAQGLADPRRLVITGGSAGGFTTLYALVQKPGFFRAGIAAYPVADQFTTALETHKFEAHYTDYLIGPLPDAAELYRERSPLYHADQIRDPLAIFHGSDDPVVPISQSESIVKALRDRDVPHEFHVYAGEGHGWRKPETVEDYYAKILDFLKRYVLFA